MKKMLFFVLVIVLCGLPEAVLAENPCKIVLCMAGKANGDGNAKGCAAAINEYFSVRRYTCTPGGCYFNPVLTEIARGLEKVDTCSAYNRSDRPKIQMKYGYLEFDPGV